MSTPTYPPLTLAKPSGCCTTTTTTTPPPACCPLSSYIGKTLNMTVDYRGVSQYLASRTYTTFSGAFTGALFSGTWNQQTWYSYDEWPGCFTDPGWISEPSSSGSGNLTVSCILKSGRLLMTTSGISGLDFNEAAWDTWIAESLVANCGLPVGCRDVGAGIGRIDVCSSIVSSACYGWSIDESICFEAWDNGDGTCNPGSLTNFSGGNWRRTLISASIA